MAPRGYLALIDRGASRPELAADGFDAGEFSAMAFGALPEEIRLRLMLRAIDRFGREGPAELGKVESLLNVLDRSIAENAAGRRTRLKQTLAGALVSLADDRIRVEPAPPRRRPKYARGRRITESEAERRAYVPYRAPET